MRRLHSALAMVAVVGALLAAAALFKDGTCGCRGGLPYGAIARWSGVGAAGALGAYVAVGVALRGE